MKTFKEMEVESKIRNCGYFGISYVLIKRKNVHLLKFM